MPPHKCRWLVDGLLVVSDAAAQFADLGYEAHLRKRRRGGARLWEHVALQLSDLTFRLLRRGVDCQTIRVAAGVFKGSDVRASWNSPSDWRGSLLQGDDENLQSSERLPFPSIISEREFR